MIEMTPKEFEKYIKSLPPHLGYQEAWESSKRGLKPAVFFHHETREPIHIIKDNGQHNA